MSGEYSRRHILLLLLQIAERGLSVPAYFGRVPTRCVRSAYNGIGPEAWCPFFRKLTTWLLNTFEADALIHDVEYTYAERTYWAFTVANARFAYNAAKVAVAEYGISRQALRYAACGTVFALLCQLFGWSGFKNTTRQYLPKTKRNIYV